MDDSTYEPWEQQGSLSDSEFLSSRREVVDTTAKNHDNTPNMIDTTKAEGTVKSFNPPTPHPQFLGELNDNQIHVRIAQLLDELRMLNIALAKRDCTCDSSTDTESQMQSPITPGFRVGRDLWYLPSARKGSVEVYDMGEGRHDSWYGQTAPAEESVFKLLSVNGKASRSGGEAECTASARAGSTHAHCEEGAKSHADPEHRCSE